MDTFRFLIDITVCLRRLGGIPLPADGRETERTLAQAGWALPVLGAFFGGIVAAVYLVVSALGLGPGLAAVVAVAVSVGLTGAGPERALAGAATHLAWREGDSRPSFGEWGTISLVLALAIRIGVIAAIEDPHAVAGALVGAGAIGYAALMAALAATAAETEAPAGEPGTPGIGAVGAAVLIGLAVSLIVVPHGWLAAVILAGLATAGLAWTASRRVPGVSGALGRAAMPVAEALALLAIAAAR